MTDGRTARAERTRSAIVAAVLALVEEGEPAPTSRAIAARAGVAEKTVFSHFADLEDLHAAVARHKLEVVVARTPALPTDGPFEARLTAFVRRRAAVLEDLTPSRRAALRHEDRSAALQASRARWTALGRATLERTFAPELAVVADRTATLAAAAAVSSWASWDEWRTADGLSVARARAAMMVALRRILT